MEHTYIKELLDKYWQAETNLEEEALLKAYFRGPEVDPSLETYRVMFGFFSPVVVPDGLTQRVLASLEASDRSVRSLYRKGWWYAAAAILAVSLTINLVPRETVREAPTVVSPIADTYKDPAQALAAVQQALRTVSSRINKGQEMTRSGMGRMSDSYHIAFKN